MYKRWGILYYHLLFYVANQKLVIYYFEPAHLESPDES